MAKVNIPRRVIPGFEVISKLSNAEVNMLSKIMGEFELNQKINDLFLSISEVIKEVNANEFLKTIVSFSELFEDNESVDVIVNNLIDSYETVYIKENPIDLESLSKNLTILLSNYSPIALHVKFHESHTDNPNNYISSKFSSSLRVFTYNKKIYYPIVNTFKISYYNNEDSSEKNIYLSLDLEDLKSLRNEISLAIESYEDISKEIADNISSK
ncbi:MULTISPECIES: hypothetical protein [Sphingobacterium]|uniref:hypothetical protein n=1 Tax=Sphingobacterium TaxID=28453 RepID=UPI00257E08BB|nr:MULTISPECIES: hypothetical protein [Sphingobacterium]